eukprot:m.90918 g.90918  ORF g.90918 m.90918 type:complete len:239 (-) comp51108_c0_seq1:77-793(-)
MSVKADDPHAQLNEPTSNPSSWLAPEFQAAISNLGLELAQRRREMARIQEQTRVIEENDARLQQKFLEVLNDFGFADMAQVERQAAAFDDTRRASILAEVSFSLVDAVARYVLQETDHYCQTLRGVYDAATQDQLVRWQELRFPDVRSEKWDRLEDTLDKIRSANDFTHPHCLELRCYEPECTHAVPTREGLQQLLAQYDRQTRSRKGFTRFEPLMEAIDFLQRVKDLLDERNLLRME